MNIGIEYDGLYWHSDEKRGKYNLIEKTNFFANMGIRIVHIFEDEWKNKQEIVKRKLKNILNCNEEKVYARKCEIREVNTSDKNEFLEKYHIQGKDVSKYRFGLFYNNKLVSIMTFGSPRYDKDKSCLELIRFASSINVVGGFSKLLNYVIKTIPNINKIVTYADLRWSSETKNVYLTNGFKLSHKSKPDYFYTTGENRIHRYAFRKSVLKEKFPEYYDPNLTEKEIMEKTKYFSIHDCGNAVFYLEVN